MIAFAATGVEAEVNQCKQIAAKQNIHVN
ncbi:hypothetical protein FHT86_007679 [Rhizobium sp. BK313]|nr:hypothetical protein [Rhizobium sp. BK313]